MKKIRALLKQAPLVSLKTFVKEIDLTPEKYLELEKLEATGRMFPQVYARITEYLEELSSRLAEVEAAAWDDNPVLDSQLDGLKCKKVRGMLDAVDLDGELEDTREQVKDLTVSCQKVKEVILYINEKHFQAVNDNTEVAYEDENDEDIFDVPLEETSPSNGAAQVSGETAGMGKAVSQETRAAFLRGEL